MAYYQVSLTAFFSEKIDVEADTPEEAEKYAVLDFEAAWLPQSQHGGHTYVWDAVNIDEVADISDEE